MKLPFLFVILLFFNAAKAEDSDILIWVRASLLDARPADAVISGEQLAKKPTKSLSEVLSEVSGSFAPKNHSLSQFQSYILQGSKSEHVLVLLDGVPINDISSPSGGFDYSLIDITQLDRIEVFKGTHSVRYGSGAFAGVVLLITKKPNTLQGVRAGIVGGSDHTFRAQSTGWGSLSSQTRILGSLSHDQGYPGSAAKESDGNTEVDGYQKWSSLFSLISESFDSSLRLSQFHTQSVGDYDATGGPGGDDPNARYFSKMFVTTFSYEKVIADNHSYQAKIYNQNFQRFENDAADSLHASFLQSEYNSETTGLEFIYVKQNYLAGVDFKYDSLDTDSRGSFSQEVRNDHRQNGSIFFAPGFQFSENKSLNPGLRLECDKDHCWWQKEMALILGDVNFRLAESFRSPSFYQLFSAYGDSSLQEEKVLHGSINFQKSFEDMKVSTSVFHNKYSDLIDFNSVTNKYINRGRVDVSGADFSIQKSDELFATPWHKTFSIAYLQTKDLSTGLALPRRPRLVVTGNSIFDFTERWSAGPSVRYRSRLEDVDAIGGSVFLKEAITANLSVKYALNSQSTLGLEWINFTNNNTGDFWGYQSEQQAVVVDLSWAL